MPDFSCRLLFDFGDYVRTEDGRDPKSPPEENDDQQKHPNSYISHAQPERKVYKKIDRRIEKKL